MSAAAPSGGVEVEKGHFRLGSPWTALVLGLLYVGLLVAWVPLSVLAHQFTFGSLFLLLLVPFAAVGVLVAARQPRNPIGWVMVLLALLFTGGADAGAYSVAAYRLGHHGLPLARLAVVLTPGWVGLVLLPLPIALFPDGRMPSRRWRWTLWVYALLAAVLVAGVVIPQLGALTDRVVKVDSSGQRANASGSGGAGVAAVFLLVTLVALSLSWVVRQLVAYHRSTGERRQQLKWLMGGGGLCIVAFVASVIFSNDRSPVLAAVGNVATVGIVALPLSIGIGILKYRLYEIDRLISRTLSYLILTGLLVGVFVGLVVLATRVLPFSSPVGVAASTLAAAGLFNPLRRRVQRLVDRRFNRARYDAEATVVAFRTRLRSAPDRETVEAGLLGVVGRAVEPAHASLWLKQPESEQRA